MKSYANKTEEKKNQSDSNENTQIKRGGEPTFQFVDNRPEAVAQRKLQKLANNSPQTKKIAQLQLMANKRQNTKVTQLMLSAARAGVSRAMPKATTIAKGFGLAGSASEIYKQSKDLDLRNLNDPAQFKKFHSIGREALAAGLSASPFGKVSSAVSLANNMYDMQDKLKDGDLPQAIKSLSLGELDKIGLTGYSNNFLSTLGPVVTVLGGTEKLFSNRAEISSGFANVAEYLNSPAPADLPMFEP